MIRAFRLLISICVCISILAGCNKNQAKKGENPLARAYDNHLYPDEIRRVISPALSGDDSIVFINNYINQWIKQQLILKKAEEYLSDEEKNVEKQIQDYRTYLLINRYQNNIVQQKLDTLISNNDIEEYYNNNPNNFLLKSNIIKALYIKISKNSPNIWQVRSWYKSDSDENIKKLESYCYQYASAYDYFEDKWIYFSELLNLLPVEVTSAENYLKYRRYIEVQDSNYYYFVNIKDYKLTGALAPVDFVKNNIKSILLNKRKIKLIKELESNIYNDALNRGQFTIY